MNRSLRRRWLDCLIAALLFAISLAVYSATLTPSLSYKSPDGNELATVPYVLGLAHSTGYPLYTWLGKLFTFIPVGDVAHRVNLMSAVLGAARAALLYLIMLTIAFQKKIWTRSGDIGTQGLTILAHESRNGTGQVGEVGQLLIDLLGQVVESGEVTQVSGLLLDIAPQVLDRVEVW